MHLSFYLDDKGCLTFARRLLAWINEQDRRYLFLKCDSEEDEIWLASNKKHANLTDHLNLVDPICYLATYTGPPFTQDFLYKYNQPSGQTVYYCSIGLWQEIYSFFKTNNVPFDGLLDHQHFFKRNIQHSFASFILTLIFVSMPIFTICDFGSSK